MLEFKISLPNKEGSTTDYPLTVSKDDVLAALLTKKGKGIDLMLRFYQEARKSENDVVQIELKQFVNYIIMDQIM